MLAILVIQGILIGILYNNEFISLLIINEKCDILYGPVCCRGYMKL